MLVQFSELGFVLSCAISVSDFIVVIQKKHKLIISKCLLLYRKRRGLASMVLYLAEHLNKVFSLQI